MNELVSQLQRFIRIWIRVGKNRLKLFKLEFKIAKSTIKPLFFLMVLLVMSLFTIWALFLILIGFGIFALTSNVLLSIAIVLFINIVFLIFTVQGIRFLVKIASFQKTRKNFRNQNIKEATS
jgi:uncharacterized membrane protein YqjE